LRHAREAVARANDVGRPALISQALSALVHTSFQFGQGIDEASLQRALALEDPDSEAPIMFRASVINALLFAHTGQLDQATVRLQEVRARCEERGAEGDLMAIAGYGALINIWRGRFTAAARLADEAVERARQIGGRTGAGDTANGARRGRVVPGSCRRDACRRHCSPQACPAKRFGSDVGVADDESGFP